MRGFRGFFVALAAAAALALAVVTYPWGIHLDNIEIRAAMAKAGQTCGPMSNDPDSWPNFDCISSANDGQVIAFVDHQQLVETIREYCREPDSELDENDWVTSVGYFVRSGSAIIYTLRKHVDFDFYSAQSLCYEL